jgi:putative transposase
LAKAQRRVARRQKGSKRRDKARKVLAKKHQKVRRQRRDFHHKVARQLVRRYDAIYLEDLLVANLVRSRYVAKSISDAGWAAFRTTLAYKAACAGKQVVLVDPAYTRQDCSDCGPMAAAAGSVSRRVSQYAPMSVPPAG